MVIKKITKVTLCIIAIIAVFSLFMAWRIGYCVNIQESNPKTCEAINLSGSTEDIDIEYKNGILTKDAIDRIGMDSYRKTFSRESWEMFKTGFDPHFIIFFENLRDK